MTDVTMAAAAQSEETAMDEREPRGTKRPAEDDFDDSTVITRAAARLLGASSLDAVDKPEHVRPVAGAYELSPVIVSDLRAGWLFHDETMQASARDQLAHIRLNLAIFSPMTPAAETLHRVAGSGDKTERKRMLRDAKDHLRFILGDLTPAQIARTLVECVFGGKPYCEGIGREWGRGRV